METLLTIKELSDSLQRVPFFPALDLMAVEEDGLAVGVSGRMALVYKVSGVDYLLYDDAEIVAFMHELQKLLNRLPSGILLSFVKRSSRGDDEMLGRCQANTSRQDPLVNVIVREKVNVLTNSRLVKKEIFLFLSHLSPEKKRKRSRSFHRSNHEEGKAYLLQAESLIITALKALGVTVERLSAMDVIREYYRKLNPSLSQIVRYEDAFQENPLTNPKFETLRSRLLLHPPKIYRNSLYMDGYFHSAANLRTLPGHVGLKMIKSFDRLMPDDSEWMITLRKKDQDKEIGKLRIRANFAHANAFFRISEDHFARQKASQYESFLHQMAEQGESVFDISLSVLIKAKDEAALARKKEAVLKAFPKLGGSVGIFDHLEHDTLFLSHLPLQADQNQSVFPVLTGALSHLLPLGEEWKGTDDFDILLKTHEDEGFALNLFDPSLPAKHAVMIGSTGSGKSFTANHLLSSFLIAGDRNHVIVIDMGGSYKKLARLFDGHYLQIDCTEEYALNLFPEKRQLFPKPGEVNADLLGFLSTLLEKMVSERERVKSSELRILEQSILKVYESIQDTHRPLLGDVQMILRNYAAGDDEDKRKAYQFSKNLSMWTEGRFGRLLNRQSSLTFDNRFIVFDLGKLSQHPELQSILFFVIRSAIARKLGDISLRKIIVIDEGWRFFNDDVGSKLIEELYRTARKTNGLVLSISQSPVDFLQSKAAPAILSNSYVKYILKLQKGHELLSKFDLNPNEVSACEELEIRPGVFSEIFIKFFNKAVTAKLEPSPLDYWIATTEPNDQIEEERLRAMEPSLSELERLRILAGKYPRGITWRKEAPAI